MEIIDCDLLCIGGGAAGATAAVAAAREGLKVVVVDKNLISYGNTRIAGGIISSRNTHQRDSADLFYQDVRKAGAYLNDPELVKVLAQDVPEAADEVERWGHHFLRGSGGQGSRHFIQVGGHSTARTLLSPYKGRSLSHVLRFCLLNSNVALVEETLVVKLIVMDGAVAGALCLRLRDAALIGIRAGKTIIACGGAGMLYFPYTDNMNGAVGDGYALALEAGAELIDMELAQYLPFALAYPKDMIGIAIGDPSNAGPYGLLRDGQGEVISEQIHLKARNEVSKIIVDAVKQGRNGPQGGVFLDLSQNRKFPEGEEAFKISREIGMSEILQKAYGREAAEWREPFEVYPTMHFSLGGVKIDIDGQSCVENLYAIGEAAGGIHGADRLGSVALAECLVFGMRAARHVCNTLYQKANRNSFYAKLSQEKQQFLQNGRSGGSKIHPYFLKTQLMRVMKEKVGIFRNETKLKEALSYTKELNQAYSLTGYAETSPPSILHAVELSFMLTVAEVIIQSALERRESVGMHNRTDFPSPGEKRNTMVAQKDTHYGLQVRVEERAGEHLAG